MRKFLFPALAALFLCGCGSPEISGPRLEILFVGNSYTYVNDLPHLFARLAASGRHGVSVDMIAPGGWTLGQHASSPETLDKIASKKWNFVVLQDQSVMPALEQQRTHEFEPSVRVLAYKIRQAGAHPVLYMTWGRQKGLPENGFADFDSMQAQLTLAYTQIGREVAAPVAPVGAAWQTALGHKPDWNFWQGDQSHPTVEGTYLAACVFYAAFYHQSPEGLGFTGGLSKETAQALQAAAAETVLTDPGRWNIR